MKINEKRLKEIITESVKRERGDTKQRIHHLSEHILSGLDEIPKTTNVRKFTDAVIKKLYRTSQPYTSHRFKDNNWRSLRSFVHVLEEVDGVKELNLSSTGPYKQFQEGAYKEYTLDITTTLGSKIGGFIRCHFCGSQENLRDVYDITVNFYRNNDLKENKNMAKIKINKNELKEIITESVKKVLKENHENYIWDLIDELKEALGPDELINRICGRLDSMTLSKMLNDIKEVELNNYSIDNEEE